MSTLGTILQNVLIIYNADSTALIAHEKFVASRFLIRESQNKPSWWLRPHSQIRQVIGFYSHLYHKNTVVVMLYLFFKDQPPGGALMLGPAALVGLDSGSHGTGSGSYAILHAGPLVGNTCKGSLWVEYTSTFPKHNFSLAPVICFSKWN